MTNVIVLDDVNELKEDCSSIAFKLLSVGVSAVLFLEGPAWFCWAKTAA